MHDLRVLAHYKCTPERLRQIFTSTGPAVTEGATQSMGADTGGSAGSSPEEALTTGGTRNIPYQGGVDMATGEPRLADAKKPNDWDIRRRFEYRIRSRVINGIATGINNTKPLQAVDMAWDAPPIQKETLPLMLWAQGKIDTSGIADWLTKELDPTTAKKFVKKENGKPIVNIPRICDISINLVRSYVTRRHAAISALWDNLWPLLKYDPRGTGETAMLRADALSQRIDIMADEYNYRHFLSQCDRDKLLYCNSLIFPRAAWDRKTSVRKKESNVPGAAADAGGYESYVTAEGVDCVNPHPSRWFWDLGAPLANVNTDNGPMYLGYWDIVPYGTIRTRDYYNIDRVVASEAWIQLVQMQSWYFQQYFNKCILSFPATGLNPDPSLMNDRTGNIGLYTAEMADKGVLLTQYFEKINPKLEGIGDYDAEVWIRLAAAGDGTVVAAEFLPSIPACYGAINANDNRVANASLATEMLPYQDMASNIVTAMIEQVRRSFTQLWVFNKDVLDDATIKDLTANAKNQEWWIDPKILLISLSEKQELLAAGGGFKLDQIVAQITVNMNDCVTNALRALGQLLALADRLVNSSPNELGQPNPREVAAREVQEISSSVQSIYSFYNTGPREQRAALKKMLYESLVACGSDEFTVPVLRRYQKKTIEAAGFKIVDGDADAKPTTLMPEMTRIMGSVGKLNFSYYFDSRDGAERAMNTQGAQVLQQLLGPIMQDQELRGVLGKGRLFSMLNIVARMAGAPDEFQIQLNDGESDKIPTGGEGGAVPPQVQQAIQQVMQAMQQLAMKDSQLEQAVALIMQKLGIAAPPQQPPGPPQPPQGAGAPLSAPVAPGAPPAPANGSSPAADGARLLQNPSS